MGIAKEICRIEKIKSVGALGGAYQHNLRLKDITNADEKKTSYNIELTGRLKKVLCRLLSRYDSFFSMVREWKS